MRHHPVCVATNHIYQQELTICRQREQLVEVTVDLEDHVGIEQQ